MLIDRNQLLKNRLEGKTVLLTGGGGGIGLEAAKAWVHMGARVIIAEVDKGKGIDAEKALNSRSKGKPAAFFPVDLSQEEEVRSLIDVIIEQYGCPDIVFHNATITPMGAVDEVTLDEWDKSYAVNFRSPLLITQLLLPCMKKRNTGTIVFVPSSGAAPYMGAYEVYKTAQIELCTTLWGELEETGIATYSIGPGLVKTDTAKQAIEVVSRKMGLTPEEFFAMNEKHLFDVEEAGLGFALSVLEPHRYNGQEISSVQVLTDFGFYDEQGKEEMQGLEVPQAGDRLLSLARTAIDVFQEQYRGWMERNVFERQWILRDFKKNTGSSADMFSSRMKELGKVLEDGEGQEIAGYTKEFQILKGYYYRQHQLLQSYEKDPVKRKEHSDEILGWIKGLEDLLEELTGKIEQ